MLRLQLTTPTLEITPVMKSYSINIDPLLNMNLVLKKKKRKNNKMFYLDPKKSKTTLKISMHSDHTKGI